MVKGLAGSAIASIWPNDLGNSARS